MIKSIETPKHQRSDIDRADDHIRKGVAALANAIAKDTNINPQLRFAFRSASEASDAINGARQAFNTASIKIGG